MASHIDLAWNQLSDTDKVMQAADDPWHARQNNSLDQRLHVCKNSAGGLKRTVLWGGICDIRSTSKICPGPPTVSSINKWHLSKNHIHTLEKWSLNWKMDFHQAKCQTIHITRSRKSNSHHLYSVQPGAGDGKLSEISGYPHFSIPQMQQTCRWYSGCCQCHLISFLRRNILISSQPVKTFAYQNYVRSKLEYASTVWDPRTKSNISKI